MKIRYVPPILTLALLSGCVNGLPRDLQDDEVTWIEVQDRTPSEVGETVKEIIKAERFACRGTEPRYSCGQGPSPDDMRIVQGHCQKSPSIPNNTVCDVFFVSVLSTGWYTTSFTQPSIERDRIEAAILKGTGGERIPRPTDRNNPFAVDTTNTPRFSE